MLKICRFNSVTTFLNPLFIFKSKFTYSIRHPLTYQKDSIKILWNKKINKQQTNQTFTLCFLFFSLPHLVGKIDDNKWCLKVQFHCTSTWIISSFYIWPHSSSVFNIETFRLILLWFIIFISRVHRTIRLNLLIVVHRIAYTPFILLLCRTRLNMMTS